MKNGAHNSRIEIHLGVIRNLLEDIANLIEHSALRLDGLNYRRDLSRDFETIKNRTYSEGENFLTGTLPRLGKWYDGILSSDNFKPNSSPVGFTPYRETPLGTCPLLCRTFAFCIATISSAKEDPLNEDHWLVVARQVAPIIRAFRSLFYLFYKLETAISKEVKLLALRKWLSHERQIREFPYPAYYDSDLVCIREFIASILGSEEWVFNNIHPRHGPGAVAGGEIGDEKWNSRSRIRSLHRIYPRYDLYYGFRSDGRLSDTTIEQMLLDKSLPAYEVATSRLLFVPKDSRGPRTISCEPTELMFVQQGVARNLMKIIFERTDAHVNFEDQTVNGSIARASSLSGEFATVDLEDASDSISVELVRLLMPDWTLRYLTALRSDQTLLPDGGIVNHLKYAPMGSAICFPLESLIFWAVSVHACVKHGMDPSAAKAAVYVYGDDIIIPSPVVPTLVEIMARIFLKVNTGKTFASGSFRESCGVDALLGCDITPLRIKKNLVLRSRDGTLAEAICKYSGKCFLYDYQKTGEYLASLVENVFGRIPKTIDPIDCLHIQVPNNPDDLRSFGAKWDLSACKSRMRGWVVSPSKTHTSLDGLSRLLKNHYGDWEMHDPSQVVVPRATKTRKRDILVVRVRG